MRIGDLVKRIDPIPPADLHGVIVGFDDDGDPIILWNSGAVEAEYANKVVVISENQ